MQLDSRRGTRIFCCYSWKDEELAREMKIHLSVLRRQGLITTWYDRQIESSREENEDALAEIDKAQVILMLISPDFMASDYSSSAEVQRALQQHETREVHVIPILLRRVRLEGALFEKLQLFPLNGKPVMEWNDPNEAFYLIAKSIRIIIKNSILGQETEDQYTRDEHQRLQDALAMIASPLREVLIMYFVEDRSLDEIAHILGYSKPTVSIYLSRAMRQLQKLFNESRKETRT